MADCEGKHAEQLLYLRRHASRIVLLEFRGVQPFRSPSNLLYLRNHAASRIVLLLNPLKPGFLMVRHTHENINQSFSCLSRHLNKHDALTNRGILYWHGFNSAVTPLNLFSMSVSMMDKV